MLKFTNVSKIYKDRFTAIKDVNFVLHDGEFCFIIGPSGAGKSTIVRLLIRQEKPTTGQIQFNNVIISQLPRKLLHVYRQQLGVVFQDLKLIESKTVTQNIRFALEIVNTPEEQMSELTSYLLSTVNLKKRGDLYPEDLSGGERQRVAIARALANNPKLLIADEPTGHLDPDNAREIIDILRAINRMGTSVLAITHDRETVDNLQERVIHMSKGKIIADEKGGYSI